MPYLSNIYFVVTALSSFKKQGVKIEDVARYPANILRQNGI
jgi:hypothetical protein